MHASLRALLTGVIDYAGLFPPAALPLEPAIRNYLQYRTEGESWMLGRFICPATRLNELAPYLNEVRWPEPPVAIAALGKGGKSTEEFLQNLQADRNAIHSFQEQHDTRVVVDAFEVRLPPDLPEGGPELRALISSAHVLPDGDDKTGMIYLESPGSPQSPLTAKVIAAIAHQGHGFGFKLRCGGLEASAFPTAADIRVVLERCCSAQLPLKFTAGLHHPIRHLNREMQTHMHGFVNVLVASVMVWRYRPAQQAIEQIIVEEDATAFTFTDDGLRWKDFEVPTETIAKLRNHVVSFGSCSFDEPRDDLRTLGWLP